MHVNPTGEEKMFHTLPRAPCEHTSLCSSIEKDNFIKRLTVYVEILNSNIFIKINLYMYFIIIRNLFKSQAFLELFYNQNQSINKGK